MCGCSDRHVWRSEDKFSSSVLWIPGIEFRLPSLGKHVHVLSHLLGPGWLAGKFAVCIAASVEDRRESQIPWD